jgi:hypothetical protein
MTTATCTASTRWYRQRILFLMAGTVTLAGVLLGAFVSPWFLILPAFAGANQLLMVAAGWCPASLVLRRLGVADQHEAGGARASVGAAAAR